MIEQNCSPHGNQEVVTGEKNRVRGREWGWGAEGEEGRGRERNSETGREGQGTRLTLQGHASSELLPTRSHLLKFLPTPSSATDW